MSNIQLGALIINVILVLAILANIRSGNKVIDATTQKNKIEMKSMDFNELMDIANDIIDQTFEFRTMLVYRLNKEGHIFSYEKELKTLVNSILSSYSIDLVRSIEKYVSRDYFISYVTQRCEMFIIERMKENIISK